LWLALPLCLGLGSFLVFAVYFYSANHGPYRYIDCILAGPVLSFAGVVISMLTRKRRNECPTLWTSGLVVCLCGFVGCVLVVLLLIWVMAAAFSGNWL
jgi:hypothetical protein